MRRVPIHLKLATALGVPLAALVSVVVLQLVHNSQEADQVRRQVALVRAATGPGGLFNALQDERNRAGINLIGQNELIDLACDDNQACRTETDRALRQFRSQIDGQGPAVRAAWAPAFAKLDGLDRLRQDIDAREPPYDLVRHRDFAIESFNLYSDMVDSMLESNAQVAVQIDDPELRQGADLSYLASREVDQIARMVRQLLEIFADGAGPDGAHLDQPGEWATVGGLWNLIYDDHFDLLDRATGIYEAAGDKLETESHATGITDLMTTRILDDGVIPLNDVLDAVSIDRDESYYGFRDDVKDLVEGKADGLVAEAERRVRQFGLIALGTVVAGILAMLLVSLSITRPLRRLTRQATDMAKRKLPHAVLDVLDRPLGEDVTIPHVDAIKVDTRDEVADVADALSKVQDSALDLAVEQAVLRRNISDSFVNLGRRNQNLLGRQLDFITELEQNEADPDALANLFRLDHLATRMRRNAESLLVLAGFAPHRKWVAPVRITDVIRAALGEVEDYRRVAVGQVEPATIVGSAAADLAHLMAELVENALTFSPPDQAVEISGQTAPPGTPADAYTLVVADGGLGMAPDELGRANRRLAGAESFTIAPSKYLGHYVAGNLAARHNIDVQLHDSPTGGITATVSLPPNLLTTEDEAGAPGTAPLVASRHGPFVVPAEAVDRTAGGLAKRQRHIVSVEPWRAAPPASGNPVSPATGTPAVTQLPPFPGTGQTTSGLTRRVRGAQLPETAPVSLRPAVPPVGAGPGLRSAGRDVYRLLAEFTAGVKRGRDETAAPSRPPDEPG